MNIKGYCQLKNETTTGAGIADDNLDTFNGKICRIMDINDEGDVLVLNPNGSALGMFESVDVVRKFLCEHKGGIVYPPGLSPIEEMAYMSKCLSRKGGYNEVLRNMVIASSLAKGEFNDSFLWAKQ